MPLPTDIGATFRVRAPSVYERGRAQTVAMQARLGASLVTPTGGTFTLRGPTGATVSTSSVTVTDSIAYATVPVDDLPSTVAYGDGYSEEWDLTINSTTITGRREAYVARRMLHCPITQADLEVLHPKVATLVSQAVSDVQGFIDEAWASTLQRLVGSGKWPEAVVEPTSLREYMQARALTLLFRSLMVASNGAADRYSILATEYDAAASKAWAGVRFRVDTDQDGVVDSLDRRSGGQVVRRGVSHAYGPDWGTPRRVL